MGCVAIFVGVFYLFGFGLLGAGLWSAWRSTQAAAWPTVPGALPRLSVNETSGGDAAPYEVKVQYPYTVDGVAYEGSRLAFGYASSSGREAPDEIYRKLKEAKA